MYETRATEVVTVIDIILGFIIGGFALVATFMLPSKTQIQNNQAPKYRSYKNIIFAAGFAALAGGVIFLLLLVMDSAYQDLWNILRMAFLFIIGIILVITNRNRLKFLAEYEATGFMEPQVMPGAYPQTQVPGQAVQPAYTQSQPTQASAQQVPAQQIGVKTQPPVYAQSQPVQTVPVQQIGIKGQPQPAQAQRVAVQPQQVARPQQAVTQPASQKPRVIVINCPRCKGKMQIDTRMMGQKMKCPHCGIEGKIG